jgi:hypothetical protein
MKQIHITLKRIRKDGGSDYRVTKIQGHINFDLRMKTFGVGDELTTEEAAQVGDNRDYELTVIT